MKMEAKQPNTLSSFIDQPVVPGDVILDLSSLANQTIKLGGGLRQDCDTVSVMKAGILRYSKPNKYWVESSQKRLMGSANSWHPMIIRHVLQGLSFPRFVESILRSSSSADAILMAARFWALCKARNEQVWEGREWSLAMLQGQVSVLISAWQNAYDDNQCLMNNPPTSVRDWVPPPFGKLKCNVDAAIRNGAVTFGAIIRGSDGRFVAARSGQLLCDNDPYLAEALAVKEALTWIKGREVSHIILESDCLNFCTAFNSSCLDLSYVGRIIQQCKIASGVVGIVVRHVRRSANHVAHVLARAADSSSVLDVWGSVPPYVPCAGDSVLGIVVDTKPDNFLVDIKGSMLAFLPVLAFEGGTRRNIPKFEAGTLIYARVVKANTGMNPELSCMDASGKAAEFGPLKEGYMFESSTGLSRILLSSPTCPVLEALGKKLSFEIAIGLNGRIWVNAPSPATTILVSNAIMNSESLSAVQQKIMVEKLLQRVQ